MDQASNRFAAIQRLATLRRLYHHIANGGTPRERDHAYLGREVTKASLTAEIGKLEGETHD
jgi:hypothetical protein